MSFSEWKEWRLGDLCDVKGGKRLPKNCFLIERKTSHPYLRVKDFGTLCINKEYLMYIDDETFQTIKNYTISINDIYISIAGTIGLVGKIDSSLDGANLTENAAKLTIKDSSKFDRDFLMYYLHSQFGQHQISMQTVGSTQPKLALSRIKDIVVSMPAINEQRKIAQVLLYIDRKIQLNNHINKTLEELAQTIFKSWFIDFEPFQDGEFEESELGMIPKGWRKGHLAEIAEINMGQSPSSDTYNAKGVGVPFYQGVRDFGSRFPGISVYCMDPKKIANPGEVLLSIRAPVGELNIASSRCCIGRGIASLTMKNHQENCYLHYLLISNKTRWQQYETGSVFKAITKKVITDFPIVIPPIDVINNFNNIILRIDSMILKNHLETIILSQLRDTLLPKLISGEIRVPVSEEEA